MSGPTLPDINKVYWIDPKRIQMHTNYHINGCPKDFADRVFGPKDKGKVKSGNWDISEYRFEDLDIVQAIKQRIINKIPWEETEFYSKMLYKIKKGSSIEMPWGCNTKKDLDKRCAYIDKLIESIEKNGFKENHEIYLCKESFNLLKTPYMSEEVSVNIGRDGQYLFQDGRHRLAIAKFLGIKKIPVKVHIRHQKWVQLRSFLINMAEKEAGASKSGFLYQPALHPDLLDIPAHNDCHSRFKQIVANLSSNNGRLLDLGSNLGYFCHKFEELGFDCIAIEYLPDISMVADKIRIAEGKNFKILTGDFTAMVNEPPLKDDSFQVVLALNIFHHFLKSEETYNKLISFLNILKVNEMYFEAHNPDEPQMKESYINYTDVEFVDFILSNSALNYAKRLACCNGGRVLYKLTI